MNIINKESKNNPALVGSFQFKFGEFDIMLPEEKETMYITRFNAGIMTLSEVRNEMNMPEIEGTNLFNWELQQSSNDLFGMENASNRKSKIKTTTSKK